MIQNVRLQQFRSYQDASYEFEPGVNIVVGPNASGKTNLIESLLVAGQGHSYRVNDRDLIQHDKDWARVDVLYDGVPRAVKLRQDGRLEKRFVVAGEQRARMMHNQVIPMVLFEPNHLQLFTQSPDLRRGYLDGVLAYTDPTYDTLVQTYRRALAQRNKLLKQPHTAPDMYFVWNVRLSEIGGQIAQRRAAFVQEHQEAIQGHYNRLVDATHDVGVAYSSRLPLDSYNEHMLRELERVVETDRLRGFTSLGPHRDDLQISIDGNTLSQAASRGETRTIVLSLKLVELSVTERARGTKPIILLDDVFSELDGARRKNLTKHLRDHQSFITTTDADIVAHHFTQTANIIALG